MRYHHLPPLAHFLRRRPMAKIVETLPILLPPVVSLYSASIHAPLAPMAKVDDASYRVALRNLPPHAPAHSAAGSRDRKRDRSSPVMRRSCPLHPLPSVG
jgi:hypothetical protein